MESQVANEPQGLNSLQDVDVAALAARIGARL